MIDENDIEITNWFSDNSRPWFGEPLTGVKIIHLPTGIVVTNDSTPSRHRNKFLAMTELKLKLEKHKPKLVWEDIDDQTKRAKVFGGWLVLLHEDVVTHRGEDTQTGWDWRPAMTFVPDPKHQWSA